jgi:hypothetical protein
MDIVIEKLAELDVESRSQRDFWKAEMVRDEEERLDREVVMMMMEKMTRHLETVMALDSAEFVWSFIRNPVVAMALMAYAGRATTTEHGPGHPGSPISIHQPPGHLCYVFSRWSAAGGPNRRTVVDLEESATTTTTSRGCSR